MIMVVGIVLQALSRVLEKMIQIIQREGKSPFTH